MKLHLISIGKNLPSWSEEGFKDYQHRFAGKFSLILHEIPLPKRTKTTSIPQLMEKEAQSILEKIPQGALVVALEVKGKSLSTPQLAQQLQSWQETYGEVCFIIGGPDGLSANILEKAQFLWSLSPLTFPHPLARLILAEQLYRAYSILNNHPYHRE